jgi:hypothetical protein
MGWRFYRRMRIIPGLRVNLSRSGPSLSIGGRGAWYTVGSRGRRVTLGWPGSGIFYTEHIPPAARIHAGHRSAFAIVIVAIGLLILLAGHG